MPHSISDPPDSFMPSLVQMQTITQHLLDWYDQNRRVLPWRSLPHEPSNPYKVWLSEVMLQQTQVPTVIPYFNQFIERFPTVQDLANASLDEVLLLWQGLGYYRRAAYLYQTAHILASTEEWPQNPEELRKLPGIGPYMAAAIAAIAFNRPAVPVDGNIRRIFERLFNFYDQPLSAKLKNAQNIAKRWSQSLPTTTRWGDFAQGLMDLGSIICIPQTPHCDQCPLAAACCYPKHAKPAVKATHKNKIPIRYGYALCFINEDDELYLEKEEEQRLLHGLMRVPLINIRTHKDSSPQDIPVFHDRSDQALISHTFSHFKWILSILILHVSKEFFSQSTPLITLHVREKDTIPSCIQPLFPLSFKGKWIKKSEISDYAFSSLMQKILQKVFALTK